MLRNKSYSSYCLLNSFFFHHKGRRGFDIFPRRVGSGDMVSTFPPFFLSIFSCLNDYFTHLLCQRPITFVEFGLTIPYNVCPGIWLGRRISVCISFSWYCPFLLAFDKNPSGRLVFTIAISVSPRPVSTILSCLPQFV